MNTTLRVDSLLGDAREQTGLDDLGDERVLVGLEKLVETYNGEANLTERGLRRQARRLTSLLATRLRLQAAWSENPSLLDQTIERPLYVISLPRTGTSALFNLLAVDPNHRPLLFWEGRYPDPIPQIPGEEDPRFVALRDALSRARKNNPAFTAIHLTRADGPEECVTLMESSFDGAQQGMEPLMEPYGGWFRGHSLEWLYDDYARLLSTLQAQRPGKRWLLKSPAHLWGIDQILRLFPDACIVQTHRHPARAVASYCSMIEALMANRTDVDRHELGRRVLDYLAASVERAMAARDAANAERFVDVQYSEFVSDPVGTARTIYDAFALEWSDSLAASMQAHAAEHRKGKHGAHSYTLEDYGLDEPAIDSAFGAYIERFIAGR